MLINFNEIQEVTIPHLNNGEGKITAKMMVQNHGKMMVARIPAGASIGMHEHCTSDDINYVISGTGKAICDGQEEILVAGVCHYCPKGASHSITNTGSEELILFTAVPEIGS